MQETDRRMQKTDRQMQETGSGIAIIKQVGDKVVIHDEHLKAF